MAGTSKSYLRKTHANQIAGTYTVAHPDGLGTMTIIPQFLHNPGGFPTVNAVDGICESRPNSDAEYFAQTSNDGNIPGGGPEKGFGGIQQKPDGTAVSKSHFSG